MSKISETRLSHLKQLEAQSIHIMREVVAEFNNPIMLYSIGKDSSVMLHLAKKAFYPAPPPFKLLHVDTTWKFKDMIKFREKAVAESGMELITHINQDGLDMNISPFTHGSKIHTDVMKTQGSRAKERIFSFRSKEHRWDPKNQRPELWNLFNTRINKGESIRVFPISNWTELDIWQYIYMEKIDIVPLYFAAKRPVVNRDGIDIMVDDHRMPIAANETVEEKSVRFRTLGCYPLTGAIESTANTLPEIIQEMLLAKTSERQGRLIDADQAGSMELKKAEGYF